MVAVSVPPVGIASSAFNPRFTTTWCNWFGSAVSDTSPSARTSSSTFCRSARGRSRSNARRTTATNSVGRRSTFGGRA